MNDSWIWKAHYLDGTVLSEYDADGADHGFAEIDLARCVAFELCPQRPGLPHPVLALDPDAGQKLVFFRRRTFEDVLNGGSEAPAYTLTYLGWKQVLQVGKHQHFTAQSLAVYCEDGTVVMANRDPFSEQGAA